MSETRAMLDTSAPSFMLLPEFFYELGKDLELGMIIPLNTETKLPDPEEPLELRLVVGEERIRTLSGMPVHLDSGVAKTASGNINIDLSFFTGVGAGVKGENGKSKSMRVTTGPVTTMRFKPSDTELLDLVSNPVILKRLNLRSRPTLYLIVGLQVAHGASISKRIGNQHGGGVHANTDFTPLQVPLNLGVGAERSTSTDQSIGFGVKSDFILAYRLIRLRKQLLGDVKHGLERKWALLNETRPTKQSIALEDYLDPEDLENLRQDHEADDFIHR